jgi:murein DD-endopeptidase MepM/ murein hydrolase activator NlpD
VGLEDEGGVGGAAPHEYVVNEKMSENKTDYAKYLINSLAQYLEYVEHNWSDLKMDIDDYYDSREHTPHVWPLAIDGGWTLTSGYGLRKNPFDSGYEYHEGIDLADDRGTQIYASASGVVTSARSEYGFGLTLVIDHGNGYSTRYSHCSKLLVAKGEEVLQGQLIALMGNTGRSTGTHLDFRVYKDGKTVNPLDMLDKLD